MGEFEVPPGAVLPHEFPRAWSVYWVRFVVDADCRATAQLTYR